jgi:hypothetical protein
MIENGGYFCVLSVVDIIPTFLAIHWVIFRGFCLDAFGSVIG